jgi:DNA-cytosine methyltransferase
MRMLDLFSGIGGFALAAKWVWEDELDIVGFCEIDKYAQKVLKKNFPGVPIYEDITKLNGKSFKNIDLLTGGFPCQDISIAGKGAGLEEGKRSSLWFEMHRIIREVRPRYALIENVPMLTIRGGTRVIADLASIGYDCEWTIIGADDVGAWHRRKRIWIVAYLPDTARKTDGQHPRNMGQPDAETYSTRQAAFRNSISSRSPKTRADVPDTRHTESQGWDKTSKRQQPKRGRNARSEFAPLCSDVPDTKSIRGRSISRQGRKSEGKVGTKILCEDVPNTNKQRLERYRGECELGESGEEVKVSRESNVTNSNSSRSRQDTGESKLWSNRTKQSSAIKRIPDKTKSNQKPKRRKDGLPDTKSKRGKRRKVREQRLDSQRKAGLSGRNSTRTTDVPDPNKQRLERYNDRKSTTIQAKTTRTNIRAENISNGTNYWSVEPDVGRVAHGIPNRVDRLKGLGNAIVPQVAALIMERIKNAQ